MMMMTTLPIPYRPDRAAVTYALNLLTQHSAGYDQLKQEVIALSQIPHGGFTGDLSALNVLVEYGRYHGEEALSVFWALLEQRGITTEQCAQTKPRNAKTAYQAAYMAQRRARLRSALALYEKLHECKLSAQERRSVSDALHSTWMLWRNEVLAGSRPGDERNEVTRLFWADIDEQIQAGLDGDLEVARRVLAESNE